MTTKSTASFSQLPVELIGRIVFFADYNDLKQLRLTNRSLDVFAKERLFRTFVLSGEEGVLGVVGRWNSIINDEHVRHLTRRVIFQPSEDMYPDTRNIIDNYDPNKEADFAEGARAITRLPNVNSVQINFLPQCFGRATDDDDPLVEEYGQTISIRTKIFEFVFGAIQSRAANNKNCSTISEMTLYNLQNCPIKFPSTKLFSSVMGRLKHFHVNMIQEHNEHEPDHDDDHEELRTFPPHFITKWLTPISQNLVSLSLYSARDNWGAFPGYYDFSTILFPQLEKLSLGYYTIAYDDQLDWLWAQKSLKRLVMQNCMIGKDIRIYRDSLSLWGEVSMRNWDIIFESPEYCVTARYSGTWSQFFDKIAHGLPNLEAFCFDYTDKLEYWVGTRHVAGLCLPAQRYTVFDSGWYNVKDDGTLSYWFWNDESMNRNFHEDHLEQDQKSLDMLAQKCRDRRALSASANGSWDIHHENIHLDWDPYLPDI